MTSNRAMVRERTLEASCKPRHGTPREWTGARVRTGRLVPGERYGYTVTCFGRVAQLVRAHDS
ncbi:MAG: hypothetical protein ACR2MQ_00285, partial [Gemmatimonadaceae bacterium]